MGCWPHESNKGNPFIVMHHFTGTGSGLAPFEFDQHGWGLNALHFVLTKVTTPMRLGSTCVETDSVLFRFRLATQSLNVCAGLLFHAILFIQCEVRNPHPEHKESNEDYTNHHLLKQGLFFHAFFSCMS
jgi:hypothetical protein